VRIATWNILASSYIRPQFFPHTPPQVLDPEWRIPAVVGHASKLGVDVLCLQEVEPPVFAALEAGLGSLGYFGTFARKDGGKPDGCATFWQPNCCALLGARRVVYEDGSPASGHVAQVLHLDVSGTRVALINTHLKWDPPHSSQEMQLGLRQTRLALAELQENCSAVQIICGDFNATPDSLLVACLIEAGFDYAHRTVSGVFTCNSNRQAKLIDYVFFRGTVGMQPEAVPPIDGSTVLPSLEQPSDHLPLLARITMSS
jgi:mRNA deadenylase 3'-5' endonuclease subunit Ccr4